MAENEIGPHGMIQSEDGFTARNLGEKAMREPSPLIEWNESDVVSPTDVLNDEAQRRVRYLETESKRLEDIIEAGREAERYLERLQAVAQSFHEAAELVGKHEKASRNEAARPF